MTKNNLITQEQGRSMIEMLGVLAIIGALSVGGLAALRVAQNKLRANVIANDAMLAAADVLPRLEILFQNANAASTTEELTPTFTPKSDTMEIWRCGTDGAEIIFNDVKKEVCENLMKITQIKGVASFGAAANNATACPDVPGDVALFGRCTELNQMVFSVGHATELCGGTVCNADQYCSYDTTATSCSNKGAGQCTPKGTKPDSITNGGITFFRSPNGSAMHWWSVQSWCRAHGGRAISLSDLGCGGVVNVSSSTTAYCNTDSTQLTNSSATRTPQMTALKAAFNNNNNVWLADEKNVCQAHSTRLTDGAIFNFDKNRSPYYAACLE